MLMCDEENADHLPPVLMRTWRARNRIESIMMLWGPAAFGVVAAIQYAMYGEPVLLRQMGRGIFWFAGTIMVIYLLGLLWVRFYGCGTHIRKTASQHDFAICGGCGHSLKGMPAHGRCSECSKPYELERVQRFWRRWICETPVRQIVELLTPLQRVIVAIFLLVLWATSILLLWLHPRLWIEVLVFHAW